jgi:hypothetical protein
MSGRPTGSIADAVVNDGDDAEESERHSTRASVERKTKACPKGLCGYAVLGADSEGSESVHRFVSTDLTSDSIVIGMNSVRPRL